MHRRERAGLLRRLASPEAGGAGDTVVNIGRLFEAAKKIDMTIVISPHYSYLAHRNDYRDFRGPRVSGEVWRPPGRPAARRERVRFRWARGSMGSVIARGPESICPRRGLGASRVKKRAEGYGVGRWAPMGCLGSVERGTQARVMRWRWAIADR